METIKLIFGQMADFFRQSHSGKKIPTLPNTLQTDTDPIETMKNIYADWGAEWGMVNILGVRNDINPGDWNDLIIVTINYKLLKYQATVDPSPEYTKNPLNKNGAAHLCLGFHKNIWTIGRHKGKYTALVQLNKCNIWRDRNKNFIDDDNIIEMKESGINLHHGYSTDGSVGLHSAGCQVIRSKTEFEDLMKNIKATDETQFSYLLIPIQNCPLALINLHYGNWRDTNNVA